MTDHSRIARVVVNVSQVRGSFDYLIPESMKGNIACGSLVEVPFGNQQVQGIVTSFPDVAEVEDVKPISELVDPYPVLTYPQIELARWLEHHSVASFSQSLQIMLLPGLRQFADTKFTAMDKTETVSTQPLQNKILALFQGKKILRGRQIDKLLPGVDWRPQARKLVQRGSLLSESYLPRPGIHSRQIKKVQFSWPETVIDYAVEPFASRSPARQRARSELIKYLSAHPEPLDLQWVRAQVPEEITSSDLEALSEAGMLAVWETELVRDPLENQSEDPYKKHDLTTEQALAWKDIQSTLEAARQANKVDPILVYGVTGSGKTELYMRAAEVVLQQGKQVIWLVPEISLTPQTVGRLMYRFPGMVGLVHSRLTAGERYDTWHRARQGKIGIITGARSALFTPLNNVGLIIVDEAHDASYYQEDETPTFDASKLAQEYARICGAVCIYGTATPDVSQYHQALQDGWKIVRLKKRALPEPSISELNFLPPIQVVDMRAELHQGNRSIFSELLTRELISSFQQHKQSILFLNRRGSATHVFCRDCGYVVMCPHCDIPLTAHQDQNQILCHTCGYHRAIPVSCPNCRSKAIRQVGIGTETVEKSIQKLLPDARILRWDADSRRDQKLSELVLTHFKNHQYDVLVGTQMVSKGLDFPDVNLVGIVLADIGLNLPDFRSPERTFQVLTQVAGRAGRKGNDSRVVLQTYQPEHYAIQAASNHDFDGFYSQEIQHRKRLVYPPFSQIVRIVCRDRDKETCKLKLTDLAAMIRQWLHQAGMQSAEVLGPLPCFFAIQNDVNRWQIVVRGAQPMDVLIHHGELFTTFQVTVNPPNLL